METKHFGCFIARIKFVGRQILVDWSLNTKSTIVIYCQYFVPYMVLTITIIQLQAVNLFGWTVSCYWQEQCPQATTTGQFRQILTDSQTHHTPTSVVSILIHHTLEQSVVLRYHPPSQSDYLPCSCSDPVHTM